MFATRRVVSPAGKSFNIEFGTVVKLVCECSLMLRSSKHVDPRAATSLARHCPASHSAPSLPPHCSSLLFPLYSTNNAYLSHSLGAVALTPAYVQLQELGLQLRSCGEGACILEPGLRDGYRRTFHLKHHERDVVNIDLKSSR